MPTTFLVSRWIAAPLVLFVVGCKKPPAAAWKLAPVDAAAITCTLQMPVTTCIIPQEGNGPRSVSLSVDATVSPGSTPSIKVLGQVNDTLIVVDSYASQAGGMGLCQAGEEKFVRVISFAGEKPAQAFGAKLESCRDNVELADDGVAFDKVAGVLHIHWLSAPESGTEMEKTVVLRNGSVEVK